MSAHMAAQMQLSQEQTTLDLQRSTYDELKLARVYTRNQTQVCLANGYDSGDDDSDPDEDEGQVFTERLYHDNGVRKYLRTFQRLPARGGMPEVERLVEEKHFDPDGVCMLDVHFGLGQPYLSRKHFYPNQRLKSEQLFFVEDERTMRSRKAGYWREYHEHGGVKSELQYNDHGVRCGFNKRYTEDGTLEWVKDYTKEQQERLADVNSRKGKMDFSLHEAAALLGFLPGVIPGTVTEVNRQYRKQCAPLHPDKNPDPDKTAQFHEVSRARDLLLKHLESFVPPQRNAQR
mmetsp:Transcript_52297/g.122453  ORF Transcript_52297/g.122453 Transcript_52297/m.122453 type:complete len:289 (-) Transcript_52297:80-946(-)